MLFYFCAPPLEKFLATGLANAVAAKNPVVYLQMTSNDLSERLLGLLLPSHTEIPLPICPSSVKWHELVGRCLSIYWTKESFRLICFSFPLPPPHETTAPPWKIAPWLEVKPKHWKIWTKKTKAGTPPPQPHQIGHLHRPIWSKSKFVGGKFLKFWQSL